MTKLYNELATQWYPLLTPLAEYEEEAALYHQIFQQKLKPSPLTILELGCGAGHNAYFLKEWYNLSLSDISENMLAISRKLNPECEHIQGDMRTLRLDKTFDAVFIHDAIMYMTTADDLKHALSTAFIHCMPAGLVLVSPDYVKETFQAGTEHGGSDGKDRGMRYLEWRHDPDPDDCTYTVDYAYLMQNPDGLVSLEHDRHIEGLFDRSTWLTLLKEVGFDAHPLTDSFGRVNFYGYKPV